MLVWLMREKYYFTSLSTMHYLTAIDSIFTCMCFYSSNPMSSRPQPERHFRVTSWSMDATREASYTLHFSCSFQICCNKTKKDKKEALCHAMLEASNQLTSQTIFYLLGFEKVATASRSLYLHMCGRCTKRLRICLIMLFLY